MYVDTIYHVSFEAGITLPDGGTAQSVALAGDEANVPTIGGVRRVKAIEHNSFGVLLIGADETTLVPWAKVRQCKVRRTEVTPQLAYEGHVSVNAPGFGGPKAIPERPGEPATVRVDKTAAQGKAK